MRAIGDLRRHPRRDAPFFRFAGAAPEPPGCG